MNRISAWDFQNPGGPSLTTVICLRAIQLNPLKEDELSCSGRRRPSNSFGESSSVGCRARHSNQNFTTPFPSICESQPHKLNAERLHGAGCFNQCYVPSTISDKNCGGSHPKNGVVVQDAHFRTSSPSNSPLGFFSKAETHRTDFCCLPARPQPESSATPAGRTHAAIGSFLQLFSLLVEA